MSRVWSGLGERVGGLGALSGRLERRLFPERRPRGVLGVGMAAAMCLLVVPWLVVALGGSSVAQEAKPAPAGETAGTGIQREFVFTAAPFASAHASTLVELRGGEMLAAWFGGTAEGKPDVAIWSARRAGTGVGAGWSAPVELAREPGVPCWNPVLFHAKSGRLWLYYKFGPEIGSWTAARRWSEDEGRTWSVAEHLPAGVYGPIRAKPLVLGDGTIVSGSSVESYGSWAAWVERSGDNGVSWTRSGPITLPELRAEEGEALAARNGRPRGIIQPSLVALGGERLRLYARSTADIGRVCVADSADGGRSWTAARAIDVPNPNAGIDAVRLRDGRIVLVYNPVTHGRSPLSLAVSADGEHFRRFADVDAGPGEYSYPALIEGSDGDLRLTYTWRRQRIRYAVVPLRAVPEH